MVKLSERLKGIASSSTLEMTARANALKKQGISVINLAAGEPDFPTPEFIRKATVQALEEGFTRYTPATGIPELKEAIVQKFRRDNQLSYEVPQIVVSCGAKHSLYNLLQVLCGKDDEVLFGSPYWVSYPELVRLAGATPVAVPTEKYHFRLTKEAILPRLSSRTKVILLNSPSNPTGSVYEREELEAVAELAVSKDLFLISDEIYEKLVYDGKKHHSVASFGKEVFERTATVNGVSKAYAMTGFRIGYFGGPKPLAEAVGILQSHSTSNPTSISQKAALAALTGDSSETERMAEVFRERRNRILAGLGRIAGLKAVRPEGAFYVFCDISGWGLASLEAAQRLLEEVHVAVVPGEGFGTDRHLRLSFAASAETIDEGIRRMEQWVSQGVRR